ncbi:MAG: DUF5665 domain-containing protein [bacterium]
MVENKKKKIQKKLTPIQKYKAMSEADTLKEYVELKKRPFRMMWTNFVMGLFRGIGFFIGMTVVGAVLVAFVAALVKNIFGGLPGVGGEIAKAIIYINDLVTQYTASSK